MIADERGNRPSMFERDRPSSESNRLVAQAVRAVRDIGLTDGSGWCAGYLAQGQSRRLALDLDLVREQTPEGAIVCECGAAPFVLTTALETCDYRVVGIDIAPHRFRSVRSLDPAVVAADAEQVLPFAESTFDLVVFNELFEHLRLDLIRTMKEVYRVTKPGGALVLSTPNLRSIKGIVSYLLHGRSYSCANDLFLEWHKLRKIGHMGHVREYTKREVVGFLTRVGFQPIEVIYRGKFDPVTTKRRLANLLLALAPSLRPNLICVFRK